MNPDKTESIVIGTSARYRVEGPADPIDLSLVSIKPTSSVRSSDFSGYPGSKPGTGYQTGYLLPGFGPLCAGEEV